MDRRETAQDDRCPGRGLPARGAAFEQSADRSQFWENAYTAASGLRVPKPLGDFLILDAVRSSGGTAIAVSDADLLDAGLQLASEEGLFIAPKRGVCFRIERCSPAVS